MHGEGRLNLQCTSFPILVGDNSSVLLWKLGLTGGLTHLAEVQSSPGNFQSHFVDRLAARK